MMWHIQFYIVPTLAVLSLLSCWGAVILGRRHTWELHG